MKSSKILEYCHVSQEVGIQKGRRTLRARIGQDNKVGSERRKKQELLKMIVDIFIALPCILQIAARHIGQPEEMTSSTVEN